MQCFNNIYIKNITIFHLFNNYNLYTSKLYNLKCMHKFNRFFQIQIESFKQIIKNINFKN